MVRRGLFIRIPFALALVFVAACGGGDSKGKVLGDTCSSDEECASNRCDELICKSSSPAGANAPCTDAYECASEHCVLAADGGHCGPGVRPGGAACTHDLQCVSGQCVDGYCAGPLSDGGGTQLDGGAPTDGAVDSHGPMVDGGAARDTSGPDDSAADGTASGDGAVDASLRPDISPVLTFGWSKTFGGVDSDYGNYVSLDHSGNVWITGHFVGSVDFGGGPLQSAGGADVYVASFTPEGQHRVSRRYGGPGHDLGHIMLFDANDNLYLMGVFEQSLDFGGGTITSGGGAHDMFLASFDAAGNHRWSHGFGDVGDDICLGLALDSSANVVITGASDNVINFGDKRLNGAGSADIVIASFDTAGSHRWSQRFGDVGFDFGQALAIDGSDNIVLTGSIEGTVDLGGGPLVASGALDTFVAGFDSSGGHLWSKRFGLSGYTSARRIALDASGNIFLVGEFDGSVDFGGGTLSALGSDDAFVAALDPTGAHRWSKAFGSTVQDLGHAISVDGAGNVLVGGVYAETVDFGGGGLTSVGTWDLFLASYDNAGAFRWSKRLGGMGVDDAMSAAIDANGDIFLAGRFQQSVDFGDAIRTSAGGYDIFVMRLPR